LQLVQWRDYSRYRRCDGLVAELHRFVAGRSSAGLILDLTVTSA
jgi:hypothetical protein